MKMQGFDPTDGELFIQHTIAHEVRRAVDHVGGDGAAAVHRLMMCVRQAQAIHGIQIRFHLGEPNERGNTVMGATYAVTHTPNVRHLHSDDEEYQPDQPLPASQAQVRVVLEIEDPSNKMWTGGPYEGWPAGRRADAVDVLMGHIRVWPPPMSTQGDELRHDHIGVPVETIIDRVMAERLKQIAMGYTPEHDDEHVHAEIAIVAAELALDGTDEGITDRSQAADQWGLVEHYSKRDRIEKLVVAAALLVAEAERLQRGGREAAIAPSVSPSNAPSISPSNEPLDLLPNTAPMPSLASSAWLGFQRSGMLWWVNRILHTFGWSIAIVSSRETGDVLQAYPARTSWLGFPSEVDEDRLKAFQAHTSGRTIPLTDHLGARLGSYTPIVQDDPPRSSKAIAPLKEHAVAGVPDLDCCGCSKVMRHQARGERGTYCMAHAFGPS